MVIFDTGPEGGPELVGLQADVSAKQLYTKGPKWPWKW